MQINTILKLSIYIVLQYLNKECENMKILITGAAGFIGFHLSKKLLGQSCQIIGIDNLNDYYDPNLKESRLKLLKKHKNFSFYKVDLIDKASLGSIFES